ncbi:hypothetical protein H0G86_010884 [Trichoderma simmonsii]|uniref:Uncharacterized protein n=1 Tax=Trichoderma simmonsii TaxID=1491479 RepID=A0A8G0LN93_9HYPO|nr:hypothetical protein H0G86_010884 [Trichoderma simmonsii]
MAVFPYETRRDSVSEMQVKILGGALCLPISWPTSACVFPSSLHFSLRSSPASHLKCAEFEHLQPGSALPISNAQFSKATLRAAFSNSPKWQENPFILSLPLCVFGQLLFRVWVKRYFQGNLTPAVGASVPVQVTFNRSPFPGQPKQLSPSPRQTRLDLIRAAPSHFIFF